MSGRVVARVLLSIGFLAASVAYSSWTAERTFFDPAATRGATHALLATPTVRTTLARELRTALAPTVGPVAASSPKLAAAISAAVADPTFAGAFEDAIMSLHRELITGGNGRVTLDSRAVTGAINRAVARVDPALTPKLKPLRSVSVPLGGSGLPHLGNARHTATRVEYVALAIALALIGGALLLAPERKTFRRAGVRTAFLAAPVVLVFAVLPHLLATAHNGALAVAATVLGAYGHRVLLSAGVLVVIGTSTWLTALALPGRRRPPVPDGAPAPARAAAYLRPPDPRRPSNDVTAPMPESLYL